MSLHRLTTVTVGVPNVEQTAAYYTEFGLTPVGGGAFSTEDGGEQFRLVHAPQRRLLEIGIGVDDLDDLARIAASLKRLDLPVELAGDTLITNEPIAGFRAVLTVRPRLDQPRVEATPYNGPGRVDRPGTRAPGILREGRVKPRKLGHVVIGSTDGPATQKFFTGGLGFKVSDAIGSRGAFMRCSTDHHNMLVQQAPVNFLHHTAWQVDDIDEVGRGATAMLDEHPERHVWGLGRHHAGSNFFWYLKDPAGNFSEYYSDLDCIIDDALWEPGVLEGARGLFNWGPPPPPSFVMPEDVAAVMVGAHRPG
jgi:catechol 2,3-dioxygenase-like lactoylglutathione lyase family enzyme